MGDRPSFSVLQLPLNMVRVKRYRCFAAEQEISFIIIDLRYCNFYHFFGFLDVNVLYLLNVVLS